jgi:hypothetical protein
MRREELRQRQPRDPIGGVAQRIAFVEVAHDLREVRARRCGGLQREFERRGGVARGGLRARQHRGAHEQIGMFRREPRQRRRVRRGTQVASGARFRGVAARGSAQRARNAQCAAHFLDLGALRATGRLRARKGAGAQRQRLVGAAFGVGDPRRQCLRLRTIEGQRLRGRREYGVETRQVSTRGLELQEARLHPRQGEQRRDELALAGRAGRLAVTHRRRAQLARALEIAQLLAHAREQRARRTGRARRGGPRQSDAQRFVERVGCRGERALCFQVDAQVVQRHREARVIRGMAHAVDRERALAEIDRVLQPSLRVGQVRLARQPVGDARTVAGQDRGLHPRGLGERVARGRELTAGLRSAPQVHVGLGCELATRVAGRQRLREDGVEHLHARARLAPREMQDAQLEVALDPHERSRLARRRGQIARAEGPIQRRALERRAERALGARGEQHPARAFAPRDPRIGEGRRDGATCIAVPCVLDPVRRFLDPDASRARPLRNALRICPTRRGQHREGDATRGDRAHDGGRGERSGDRGPDPAAGERAAGNGRDAVEPASNGSDAGK